ncbi:alpha/beta fold hydrolase [Nocardia sp. NPDC051990]|uniref:alpha/beta hydrolase n=1 Tax=Nocardia sp. NPDC051990 TaxID=3155285 RepID=UPI0034239771
METSPEVLETHILDGVALTECICDPSTSRAPVVLVHGGCHGAWQWEATQRWLATVGRSSTALDWYSHGASRRLSVDEWIARGIQDVQHEIGIAVREVGTRPVLVGHSMGGLAALSYAATHTEEIAALVLLTPVVPVQFAGAVVDLPVDLTVPWQAPPPDIARKLFYGGASEADGDAIYAKLQAESPRAVWEATRWMVDVDVERVTVPVLVIAGETDQLTPADLVSDLARGIGADLITLPSVDHGVTFDPSWPAVRARIDAWISDVLGEQRL